MGHQGNSGVSLSLGLQLICDAYGCGDEGDDEDTEEDVAENADEEGEEAASHDDIPTRNQTFPEEVMMKSIWQSEPAYLTLPREQLLVSRQFEDTMQEEEMRAPEAEFNLAAAVPGVGVREVMTKSNWDETVRVMARLLKGQICADKDKVHNTLTVKDSKVAMTLQFTVSTEPSIISHNKEQLSSLRPVLDIVYTVGRWGRSILKLMGIPRMPALARNTRLAMMIIGETSRAVKLLATAGYCSDDFLTAYHRSALNFAELDTLFSSVAHMVCLRTIMFESFTEEDAHATTPTDLLLQRIKNTVPRVDCGTDDYITRLQEIKQGGQRFAVICLEEQVISANKGQEEVNRSETDVAEEEKDDTRIL